MVGVIFFVLGCAVPGVWGSFIAIVVCGAGTNPFCCKAYLLHCCLPRFCALLLFLSWSMPGFTNRVKKKLLKKKRTQVVFQMDMANKALCYAHRNPPPGNKETKLEDIQNIVRNMDGGEVSLQAISLADKTFHQEKQQRGRKKGWRKTTKAEDKFLLKTFHKLRPPGCGVDSRKIHTALPKKLKNKIVRRTVIRRLAAKGFTAQEKLEKNDVSKATPG